MRQLIERHQESLVVCDNPVCDFTVPYRAEDEDKIVLYLNKPCPLCGENLLTEKDYTDHLKLMKVVNFLNRWFSWLMFFVPKKRWDNRTTLHVHVHNGVNIRPNDEKSS